MKFSWHLLRSSGFIHPWPETLQAAQVAEQLTMAGLELEQLEQTHSQDTVLELNITPNRGDCLSVRGVCREIAALNDLSFHESVVIQESSATTLVPVMAVDACPLYSGQWFSVPTNLNALPDEISGYLQAAGISLVHPIVDLTNYVMLVLGQPLQAFDADKITALTVRFAQESENFIALGNRALTLTAKTLVVADCQGVHAIAGVIGGQQSAVTDKTQRVFIESAHFKPDVIAGKARHYGLQTDAAYRFERGVDPALPQLALQKFALLAQHYLSLVPGERVLTQQNTLIAPVAAIFLTASHIERLLGFELHTGQIEKILTALGMHVTVKAPGWSVIPPSFRFDIRIEADLIEELARIHGFEHIPTAALNMNSLIPSVPQHLEQMLSALVHSAYHEVISYSFISEALHELCFPQLSAIRLKNPLSAELAVMRVSLWPSLLQTYLYNQDRQQNRAKLFENGLIYTPELDFTTGTYQQPRVLAGLMTGAIQREQWAEDERQSDFFDLKADVEKLLQKVTASVSYRFVAAQHGMLHPGQCAAIYQAETLIGYLGQLHPQLQQSLGLNQPVFLFELQLDVLPKAIKPVFKRFSKFPTIKRRFAFFVPRELIIDDFCAAIRHCLGEQLVELVLFDVYQGKGVASNEKSVAFSVVLEDQQQTWEEIAITRVSDRLVSTLTAQFSARLRDGS